MRRPTISICLAALLVIALLPAVVGAQTPAIAPAGGAGGDQQGTASFDASGPVVVGPEYIEPIPGIESPGREVRLIADSEGHLLVQGSTDDPDESVEQLIALNAEDGSVAWRVDGISIACQPVATADGRIFAQRVPNFEQEGDERNFSADPVEIDASTGEITNRYTSPDTGELPRIGVCFDGLRLGADGVLVAYQGSNFEIQLVGFDTTVPGMSELWRVEDDRDTATRGFDRAVMSEDGTVVTFPWAITNPDRSLTLEVLNVDVATGDVLAQEVIPGTSGIADALVRAEDQILVGTQATGGQDDPNRIISLDPDTLQQNWIVEAVEDTDLDRIARISLAGDVIAVHTSDDLVGLDLSDGSVEYRAVIDSFSNNGAQLVSDAEGRVYTSSFGGVPLQVFDGATGTNLFTAPEGEEFLGSGVIGEASTLGPVLADGRLYAVHQLEESDAAALVAYGAGTARLDGGTGDPIDIAIQLCQYLFGDDQALTVVLSRDDVFADTLAGAPLAGDHSCILFTPGGPDAPIDPRTLAEIERALPDGATVRIAGGVNAVSQQVEDTVAAAGFVIERLEGPSRIETAVEIARIVAVEGADRQPNGEVIAMVARADDWPDAVAGGAALSAQGSPVLLTPTDNLHPATAAAITELGITTTIIAGGTAAVSDAAANATPNPIRVSGPNRHATAAAFATDIWSGIATEGEFVLANLEFEQGWALALAASPLSVRIGAPQLGVRADNLPVETSDYLTSQGVTNPGLIVLGDLTVISGDVVDAVEVTTGP